MPPFFLRKGRHYALRNRSQSLLLDALYTTHQRAGHSEAVDVDDDAPEDFRRRRHRRRRRRRQSQWLVRPRRSPPLFGALLVELHAELGALDGHVRAKVQRRRRRIWRSRRRQAFSAGIPLAAVVGASWSLLHRFLQMAVVVSAFTAQRASLSRSRMAGERRKERRRARKRERGNEK